MSRAEPRLSAYGLFGIGNLGNEGSLLALTRDVRAKHPHVRLSCLSADPAHANAEHQLSGTSLMAYPTSGDVPVSGLRKLAGRALDIPRTFRLAGQADVVVVPGMGVLEETLGVRPWGLPYWLFLMVVSCRLRRRAILLVSVGADHPANPVTRFLFRWSLRLASYRSYRDNLSREAARSLGVRKATGEIYPDLAFALPAPTPVPLRSRHIAVGVMRYHGADDNPSHGSEIHERYIASMAEFIGRLADSGCTVSLLIGDRVDRDIALELEGRVTRTRPTLAPEAVTVSPASTLAELMTEMSSAEAVVGSRFHNVVCALLLAKPTVSVAYAPKNDELMAQFGLSAFCQSLDTLDVDVLSAQLDEVRLQHPKLEPHMRATAARYKAELEAQFDLLSRAFLAGVPLPQGAMT